MPNDPKTDLIYAILAMDAYNRGYGTGISGLETDGNEAKIGSYIITSHTDNRINTAINPSFAAGFYAIAYKKGTGASAETVIAYRGTDDNIGGDKTGGSDARYGYGIALGATPDGSFNFGTDQARLAAQFYESVTEKSDTQADANVVLTGHSLGGGLAGYVGVTSGTRAVLFDHLPFDVSGLIRANQLNVTPQWNQMHGYFTEGEFLQATRNGALQTILGALSVLIPVAGPVVAAILAPYGGSLGGATAALEANIAKTSLHSNANLLNPFSQYHSMALLTALQWNEAYGDKTWVPAAQEL